MLTNPQQINNLETLRAYINTTLCHREQLEVGAFRLTERVLRRGDKPCGMFFCLHGPRSVKITAIWEVERNTVLFYAPNGTRFHKVQLVTSVAFQSAEEALT